MTSRRASRVAASLGAVLGFAVAGCVTDPSEYLQVVLSVSDTIVSPSQPIDVEVSVANYGTGDAKVARECSRHFEVSDVRGAVVGPEAATCTASPNPSFTLRPGESTAYVMQWAGEGLSGAQLPYSLYRLEGWITPHDRDPIYTGGVIVLFEEDSVPPAP